MLLSLNAGSSSLKISLYALSQQSNDPVSLLLTSSISNISSPPAIFSFHSTQQHLPATNVVAITDHASAFAHFLDTLSNLSSVNRTSILYICHRVVHGGDYSDPVLITQDSYHHIQNLSDLAPLHNGAALSVIKACIKELPQAKSVACFDTAFHRSIPRHISTYAIDQDIATKRGLRKYGFHGLSYAFILRAVSTYLEKSPQSLNLILLHLGSGASICAVKNGLSFDTSMGLTPLSGLPGATRSGAIDPSLIFHYTNKAGKITHDPGMASNIGVTMAEDILNRKAGWKSITGTTDFGVITQNADLSSPSSETNPNRLAFDLFLDRILGYIGSYHLKLGGDVDAIVFAGGIGEHSEVLRRVVGEQIACLGYPAVDDSRNNEQGQTTVVYDISKPSQANKEERQKRILVCRTDEQLEMARECALAHQDLIR